MKEGPLTSFMCSIKKTFFHKSQREKARIKIMSSFYNIDPNIYIYIYIYIVVEMLSFVASHLMISSPPRSEMRHVKEREEREQPPIFS